MKKRQDTQLYLMIVIVLITTACGSIETVPPTITDQPAVRLSLTPIQTAAPTKTPQATITRLPTLTRLPTETQSPTQTASPTQASSPTQSLVLVAETSLSRLLDGMVMLYVPEGEFIMGNNRGLINERPQHQVDLDAYLIDQTEVTNAMFTRFIEATGYQTNAEKRGKAWAYDGVSWSEISGANWQHPQGPATNLTGLENHPVVNVSWDDAKAYCEWAGVRLPTEAEWEKAARGTNGSTYPWGEEAPAGNLLNFADFNLYPDSVDQNLNDGYRFTAPVGSYPAGISPFGVLDMAGNVWEWVADWYQETYYRVAPTANPVGPNSGEGRVFRGGSWNHDSMDIRSSIRMWSKPYDAIDNVGFRCAISTP